MHQRLSDPPSYIQLLVHEIIGIRLAADVANAVALVTLAVTGLLGTALAVRDRRRDKMSRDESAT